MSAGQKIIKYCAIAVAIFIIITIFGGGFAVLTGVLDHTPGGLKIFRGSAGSTKTVSITKEFEDIHKLSVDLNGYKLIVKQGENDFIKVEAKDVYSDFKAEVKSGHTLSINDEKDGFLWFAFNNRVEGVVTVTIPKQLVFQETSFDVGSGNTAIKDIKTEVFTLDSGSGAVSINNLLTDQFDIDTGSGAVEISNAKAQSAQAESGSGSIKFVECIMNNMDLSMGSGRVFYDGVLTGETEVDGGSGSLELSLVGDEKEYAIESEAGSGGCYLNGDSIDDVKLNQGAKNELSIDGGSGEIQIEFKKK